MKESPEGFREERLLEWKRQVLSLLEKIHDQVHLRLGDLFRY